VGEAPLKPLIWNYKYVCPTWKILIRHSGGRMQRTSSSWLHNHDLWKQSQWCRPVARFWIEFEVVQSKVTFSFDIFDHGFIVLCIWVLSSFVLQWLPYQVLPVIWFTGLPFAVATAASCSLEGVFDELKDFWLACHRLLSSRHEQWALSTHFHSLIAEFHFPCGEKGMTYVQRTSTWYSVPGTRYTSLRYSSTGSS
jgi:hypothetical protein